jgi:hypothetical protein
MSWHGIHHLLQSSPNFRFKGAFFQLLLFFEFAAGSRCGPNTRTITGSCVQLEIRGALREGLIRAGFKAGIYSCKLLKITMLTTCDLMYSVGRAPGRDFIRLLLPCSRYSGLIGSP